MKGRERRNLCKLLKKLEHELDKVERWYHTSGNPRLLARIDELSYRIDELRKRLEGIEEVDEVDV